MRSLWCRPGGRCRARSRAGPALASTVSRREHRWQRINWLQLQLQCRCAGAEFFRCGRLSRRRSVLAMQRGPLPRLYAAESSGPRSPQFRFAPCSISNNVCELRTRTNVRERASSVHGQSCFQTLGRDIARRGCSATETRRALQHTLAMLQTDIESMDVSGKCTPDVRWSSGDIVLKYNRVWSSRSGQ